MSAFLLASSASRSTGSLCPYPLPHGDHGAEEEERAVTQAASVEISPDWGGLLRGAKSGVEGVLSSRGVTWAEATIPRCNELAPIGMDDGNEIHARDGLFFYGIFPAQAVTQPAMHRHTLTRSAGNYKCSSTQRDGICWVFLCFHFLVRFPR